MLSSSFEDVVRAEGATPATTKNGRTLTEIFRDGAGYETLFVTSSGLLTTLGARKLINHLRDIYDVPLWRPPYEARFAINPPHPPPTESFEQHRPHFKKTNLKKRYKQAGNPKYYKRQRVDGTKDERAHGKPTEKQQRAGPSKPRNEPSELRDNPSQR